MCAETLLTHGASYRSPLQELVANSKLATVLNEARHVCAARNASKEWQSFEQYMYACLRGTEDQPEGHLTPFARPGEEGYVSFPKWAETFTSFKNLIECLRELKERIEEANPGDFSAHLLVKLDRPPGLL